MKGACDAFLSLAAEDRRDGFEPTASRLDTLPGSKAFGLIERFSEDIDLAVNSDRLQRGHTFGGEREPR